MVIYVNKIRGCLLTAVCLLVASFAAAQYKIHFIVSDTTKKKEIFIAGNFNDWNSGDTNYILKPVDETHKEIVVQHLKKGHYEFKFTKGTWGTVETTAEGIDIDNRVVELNKDTTIHINIAGWVGDYKDFSAYPDSLKMKFWMAKSYHYLSTNLDTSYKYALAANELAQKRHDKHTEGFSLNFLGNILKQQGNYAKALRLFFQEQEIFDQIKDTSNLLAAYFSIGNIFQEQKDYTKAKYYYFTIIKFNYSQQVDGPSATYLNLGKIYFANNNLDSALYWGEKAYGTSNGSDEGEIAIFLGDINKRTGNFGLSLTYYRDAVNAGINFNNLNNLADGYARIAGELKENNQMDSGFYYSKKAFDIAQQINTPASIISAGTILVDFFKIKHQLDSAFIYQQIVLQAKNSLSTADNEKEIQKILFDQQLQQEQAKEMQAQYRSRTRIGILTAGLIVLLLCAFFLYRNNKHKQQANTLLQNQKQEIENTLGELRATQKLLIQSEKMASLGELTAGIAHEIQNPLNFVNNFSEVTNELIDEAKEELTNNNQEEAFAILDDIKQNLEKINHHGKRADAIVKGMLQHSRKSTGHKELTDINALADEYLRLSYNGLRARDKAFAAAMRTDFDNSIGKINIIPQDIGRVLLNLFNNAFYAVTERLKVEGEGYKAAVSVATKKVGDKVEIRVKDNGNGIPPNIIDKIFQPFFTTKPTGQGTGLGLSLSYDIVKAHGGEIKVETKGTGPDDPAGRGEGTEFIVRLPVA